MSTERYFNEGGTIYDENRLIVGHVIGQEQDDSVARRMAASGEMLDALKFIVGWNPKDWSPESARQQATAAIASAEPRKAVYEYDLALEARDALKKEVKAWQVTADRYGTGGLDQWMIVLDKMGWAITLSGEAEQPQIKRELLRPQLTGPSFLDRDEAEAAMVQLEAKRPQFAPYTVWNYQEYAQGKSNEAQASLNQLDARAVRQGELEENLRNLGFEMEYDAGAMSGEGHLLKRLPDGELVDPVDEVPNAVLVLAKEWSDQVDLLKADRPADVQPPPSDLLDALRSFSDAVWSDVRLPGDMREELKAVYHNRVRPAIADAAAAQKRRLETGLEAIAQPMKTDRPSAWRTPGVRMVGGNAVGGLPPSDTAGRPLLARLTPLPLPEIETSGRIIAPPLDIEERLALVLCLAANPGELEDDIQGAPEHIRENKGPAARARGEEQPPQTEAIHAGAGVGSSESMVAWEEAGASREDVAAMHSAGGYAAILVDERVQRELQDLLDHCMEERLVGVRNALRVAGWDGPEFGVLRKEIGGLTLAFDHRAKHVGAGRNVVSVTYAAFIASTSESRNSGWEPVLECPDGMLACAADMAALFEHDLEAALRARGIEVQMHPARTSIDPEPG